MFKRFIPLFVSVLLLLACIVPSAVTQTSVPPSATSSLVLAALTDTPGPATDTPAPVTDTPNPATDTPGPGTAEPGPGEPPTSTAQPPSGARIAHLPAGQAIKITFIKMLDAAQGWAIGGLNGSSDHVLHTSDGGLTWKDLTPPEPAPADPQMSKKALGFFMDNQKAWVAFSGPDMAALSQAYIWYTTDGGTTWQYSGLTEPALYSEAYFPSDLFFVDAQHGWMMAHTGAGMNHDYYALLATNDGGVTWKTLLSPNDDNSGTQGGSKSGLVFVTPLDGWMTVDYHGVVSIPYFFKTHDGGVTWEGVNLPAPPSLPNLFDQNQGYCDMTPPTFFTVSSADLVLNCKQFTSTTTIQKSFLYETTDGGTSWKVYDYPGGPLQFINALTAYSLGRAIQRSVDAGHTWAAVKTVNWDGQFSFVDANTAWAVATDNGQVALVKTSNGGLNWQELKPKVAP
jgi:photosystem II stability/assembly factor-like uncharacterized protein